MRTQGLGRIGQVLFLINEEEREEGVGEVVPGGGGGIPGGVEYPRCLRACTRGHDGGRGPTFAVAAGRGVKQPRVNPDSEITISKMS
jgi:hypothetical protein